MSRERKMPSNVDAEQAVLGACLLDRDAIFAIDLAANEFYLEKHQNIYAAMAELARADVPIDLLSVQSKLTAQNRLTESGGIVYLTDLLSSVPSASHVTHYAALVRATALDRRLIQSATAIAELGYDNVMPTAQKLENAQHCLNTLETTRLQDDGAEMRDIADRVADKVKEYYRDPRETFGIPTHLDVDKIAGGLAIGDFWIIVGDPGNGKTALLHQILANVARDGVASWLFSFEMIADRVCMRMACERASMDSNKVRRGDLSEQEYENYIITLDEVRGYPIRIFDNPCSMLEIDAKLRRAKRQNRLPQIVAVDYSKLLTDKGETEIIRVGNITRMGKMLATRYGVTVLMIHVINGESAAQDRMPQLRDLGWSRQSQYDPDIVIATHKTKGVGILKNREGEAGDGLGVPLVFVPQYTRWGNKTNIPEPTRRMIVSEPPVFDMPMVDERHYA